MLQRSKGILDGTNRFAEKEGGRKARLEQAGDVSNLHGRWCALFQLNQVLGFFGIAIWIVSDFQ